MQRIEIFKPGRHTAMSGETFGFSEQQLRDSAEAYDPALHEAPIVVGHPSHDHPAYGWVKSLEYGETLEAIPDQVEPQFAELVEAGRFKKVSASFYRPDSPSNPKPGVYYLRHVGFLGAQPPAIKGLKQIEFADGDSDVIELEFGEVRGGVVKRLFRALREHLIGKEGREAADEVLPDWAIENLEDDSSSFSEPGAKAAQPHPKPTPEVTDVDKQELERREKEAEAREARIAQQEAEFAEREQKHRAEASAALVDDLVKQGRVLPKHRDGLVAFMANQEAEGALEFGEGSDKVKTTGRDFLEGFLKELPVAVDYAERGAADEDADGQAYATPEGYHVDPDKARVHGQALAYQEKNNCDYVTAVRAVQRGGSQA
ncbi:hypothetical protein [Billgrantia ethanolica]|uniref:Peptidase n=1 Tax=Billgrantia ethanolica TaxID=2733486 RepID=A0ABS9A878_9GAMM|nr:hypothetical protein [Halomonas ethanolica]MCE8004230.1 peptidase [Halomonas ethanolica]